MLTHLSTLCGLSEDIICHISVLNCLNVTDFAAYFVELCTDIIPNVSNNVQNKRNL